MRLARSGARSHATRHSFRIVCSFFSIAHSSQLATTMVQDEAVLFAEESQCLEYAQDLSTHEDALIAILDKYLECPTLLDPSLERLTEALSSLDTEAQYRVWYTLSKVRSIKVVRRFLPHEVSDVPRVWKALQRTTAEVSCWQSRYIQWHWLGMLRLIPFDMDRVMGPDWMEMLWTRLQEDLSDPGPIRDAAAVCGAQWYLRTPSVSLLEWSLRKLATCESSIHLRLGILQLWNHIVKHGSASDEVVQRLDDAIRQLTEDSSLLWQRQLIKWWTRTALLKLQSLPAYRRRCDLQTRPTFFVVDETVLVRVEATLGRILPCLSHSATIVRWAAAKAVGRLLERLPLLCCEDAVEVMLDMLQDEEDRVWHGVCLALAELARRGILGSQLDRVVPFLLRALKFDVVRGSASVGSNVRDAACYTYWALARTYKPEVLRPYWIQLSQALVVVALLDREVNCRRAASAALQEGVGRQGALNVPHGIELVTTADYYSLGNRTDSYLGLAKCISSFDEYRRPIIRHLATVKLFHWDLAIRKLASQSLAGIAVLDIDFAATCIIPTLLDQCLDDRFLNVRHGATIGVAEVILSVSQEQGSPAFLSADCLDKIVSTVPEIERRRLYRGRGGETMRHGVCRLVECISRSQIPLGVRDQIRLLDAVDSCLSHPNDDNQKQASVALECLLVSYFPVSALGPSERLNKRVLEKFCSSLLSSENPAESRGSALALGSLPLKLIAYKEASLSRVLAALSEKARPSSLVGGEPDAETRRNCLLAISSIADRLFQSANEACPIVGLGAENSEMILDAFFLALDDYNVDRRGDVGSWCRITSMNALTAFVCHANAPRFSTAVMEKVLQCLLKQFSEKLDTIRRCAGRCLGIVLSYTSSCQCLQHMPTMTAAMEAGNPSGPDWGDARVSFAALSAMVTPGVYFHSIVSGLIISAGDLSEGVSREAMQVLDSMIQRGMSRSLASSILDLLRGARSDARVAVPLSKTLFTLVCGPFIDVATKDSTFLPDLALALLDRSKLSTSVPELLSIADIGAILCGEGCCHESLQLECALLHHQYPNVRARAAQHLFVWSQDCEAKFGVECLQLSHLLSSTAWSSSLSATSLHRSSGDTLATCVDLLRLLREGDANNTTSSVVSARS